MRATTHLHPTARLATLSRVVIGLEVLLSAGALVGGAMLIVSPDGSAFGMPLTMLQHTPFDSFRIPGLLLFGVIGLGPLVSVTATLRQRRWAAPSVIVVGAVLIGWILIQVALIRSFMWSLHGAYLVLGVVLAVLGVKQDRAKRLR